MTRFHRSIYALVAVCSVVLAACQPAEGPTERVGRDIDQAARKLAQQVDKTADKADATDAASIK